MPCIVNLAGGYASLTAPTVYELISHQRENMKPIKAIIIDGAQIHSEADFHRIMAQHYDFGPYYGNNLGAFRDMVTSGFLMNTLLVWKNSAISKQRLGAVYNSAGKPLFRCASCSSLSGRGAGVRAANN